MKAPIKLIACMLATGLIMQASAMEVAGIKLPTQREGLELQGAGLLRKGLIFRIYVGALYTDASNADTTLSDQAKRIDIYYFHKTPKKHMIRVAEQTLLENLTSEEYEQIASFQRRLHDAYMDGRKGSYASIIHQPGQGLIYRFDNQDIISIPCDDFAKAYFSIWLGEKPSSKTMKDAMLGGQL